MTLIWRVLRYLTDDALATSIVGDLAEERVRRARAGGALRATAWHIIAMSATIGQVASRTFAGAVRRILGSAGPGRGPADLRHAVRSLRRAPWYAGTVVGVIALSMALATTVFAVVDGVLFKPLPYANADELYSLEAGFLEPVRGRPFVGDAELSRWAEAMPDVQFTGFSTFREAMIEKVNERDLGAARVQQNFFEVIGVRPLIGGFLPAHFAEGAAVTPIIISHRLWRQRFDRDPDVVGLEIVVDPRAGGRWQVVGVMPEDFVLPSIEGKAEVLLLPAGGLASGQRLLEVVMRVPPSLSSAVAQQRLEAVMLADAQGKELAPGGRRFNGPFNRAVLHPLGRRMADGSATLLTAAFAAGVVVVLIACLNVSGLMAARSLDRSRELSLRRALGARSGDLARAVLVENALLVVAGAMIGAVASPALLRIALSVLPERLLLLKDPALDWRVAAFVALATTACLTLASAWAIRRALVRPHVADGLTPTSTRRIATFGHRATIGIQVALGLVLVMGGVLLVGSVARAWQNDFGINPDGLGFVELRIIPTGRGGFGEPSPGVAGRLDEFLADVRSVPGVDAAGAVDAHVLDRSHVEIVFFQHADQQPRRHLGFPVTSGYLEAAGIEALSGRLPTAAELNAGAAVVVMSQSAADEFWPGESPIGKQIFRPFFLPTGGGLDSSRAPQAYVVVGVVEDALYSSLDGDVMPVVYGPYRSLNWGREPVVAVRARHIDRVLPQIIELAETNSSAMSVVRAKTATAILADTIRQRRFLAWLFGAFAVAALTLVGVGILGVVAMAAARRTREVGIRMALGSTRDGVVRLLVGEQLRTVVVGLLAGGLGAAWAVRFVEAYLYELTVFDPRVWGAALLAVVTVSILGAVAPALRASRVNPVVALRDHV